MNQQVFFVGTRAEVQHHAAPLSGQIQYKIVDSADVVAAAQPGDLAIFYSEHFDRFREAIQQLKEKNVATLYMIDGILEWRNAWENRGDEPACPFTMRPVLAHKVACIGNSQARTLAGWGNGNKVEVVGVPRFDRLAATFRDSNEQEKTTGNRRLLVMTAKFPAYTPEQEQRLESSLRDLKSSIEKRPDIEVVWRLTRDWDKRLGVANNLTDLSGRELAETLSGVDAVVSTPSTSILEAMLHNLPVTLLDYNNSPQYVPAAWNVSAADHLDAAIEGVLNPTAEKLLFQRHVLADALQLNSNAADRMCELIRGMLQVAKTAVSNQTEAQYPANMLPTVRFGSAADCTFEHADYYPEFPEFRIEDRVELQAQLAHARREINHLSAQLEQLQTELKQAHAIFDEINSHPIAGPVVRIRRKLAAILEKFRKPTPEPL